MVSIAIMGHGTVGSGVAELLINHQNRIENAINDEINVKYILDLRDFADLEYSDRFIKDFNIIINDPEVQIVAEAMGGLTPAYDFVKQCLLNGKSVVTSNKELVAAKGAELINIANKNNVNFLFEASVGGGIPVLRPMVQCLAANEITEVKGILNGTTNYILNKMIVDSMDFNTALKLAQDKGYAEKNPDADVKGYDACRKICILATLAFGKHVYPEQVYCEGIENITLSDVENADNFNCVIKLIGSAKRLDNGKITASVRPTLVPRETCMLANVNGVFNAVLVTGDAVDDVMFYGPGAGKMPTASAVVADIVDCAKHIKSKKYLNWQDGEDGYVITPDEPIRLFVNAHNDNFQELINSFNEIFPNNSTNVKNKFSSEINFITELDKESILTQKINLLKANKIKVLHTLL